MCYFQVIFPAFTSVKAGKIGQKQHIGYFLWKITYVLIFGPFYRLFIT